MIRNTVNIIFVSNSMAKARTLSVLQVSMIALALVLVPVFITLLLIEPQDALLERAAPVTGRELDDASGDALFRAPR